MINMNNLWLQLKQTVDSASMNLLCFPFAGGYGESFMPWRKHLPMNIQLCPLQLPGRSYRWKEPVYTDIQQLLMAMKPPLEDLLHESPYILFGHSMGGYIAYEFSNMLIKQQLPLPELLVVSSIPAPKTWVSRKLLSDLTEKEFYDFFFDLGGFHPSLLKDEKFIKSQMSLLRDDILLCESCQYAKPAELPFPILAMGGVSDAYVSMDSMEDWRLETSVDFHLHGFDGQHFYLNDHLPEIMKLIKKHTKHPITIC